MKLYHRILLFFAIIFFFSWIVQVILTRMDYMLNIQIYFPISLSLLLFGLMGLFSFLFLFFFSMGGIYKVLLSLMALMGIFFLSLAGVFSDEYRYSVDAIDDYQLIIVDRSFLFGGYREIYQQINGLVARKVISCEGGDDYDCQYEIEANQLRIDVYYEGTIFRSEWVVLYP